MKNRLAPLLILLSCALICHNLGPISTMLENAVLLTVLGGYFVWTVPPAGWVGWPAFAAYLVGCLVLQRFDSPVIALAGLGLMLTALSAYARRRFLPDEAHVLSALTTVFFTLVYFLYRYFPEGWYAAESCAHGVSAIASAVYSVKTAVGPTAFGLFLLVSFLIFHCVRFALNRRRSATLFIATFVYSFSCVILYIGLIIWAASIVNKYTFAVMRTDLNLQAALFLMLSVPVFFQRKPELLPVSFLPDRRAYKYALPCLAVFCLMVVWTNKPFMDNDLLELKTVKFYKTGALDWETARFGKYGKRSGGMFGTMPRYLKKMGFRSRMLAKITPEELAEADVLVMINLNVPLNKQELFTVWRFVKSGGGLLLLGDHTNLAGLMKNFNMILKPMPLRFKFDSAMPSRYTWDYLMDIRPHALTNGFDHEIRRSWWVGASLDCRYPAIPLVSGKYCYSDRGYKHNKKKAFLGNRRFDYYERQNDVVLAAVARYGRGKVMACGDTSAYHNTTFMTTYPFVVNSLKLLSNREASNWEAAGLRGVIAVLLAAAGCIFFCFVFRANVLMPALMAVIIGSCLFTLRTIEQKQQIQDPIPYESLPVAFLDYAHGGRFDLMSWEDDSIGGLKNNLVRNGFSPFLMKAFDPEKLIKSKLFIIIAPTRPYRSQEVKTILGFVRSGGTVMLSVGWEEKEASGTLLKAVGMDIDNLPLAWCEDVYRGKMGHKQNKRKKPARVKFSEAWPVLFSESSDIEVIAKPLGYPVIVKKSFGKGKFIVIGDSNFLLNRNLEDDEKYYVPNMFLLRDLLDG